MVLNLLLFVPLGAALRRAGLGARGAVAAGAALSIAIELLQGFVIAGRDGTISDVVTNTAGTLAGAAIAAAWPLLSRPAPAVARWLALAGAVAWAGVLVGSDLALRPATIDGPLEVSWSPERPGMGRFTGTVLAASASESPLGANAPPPPALLAGIARGEATLALVVHPGPATPALDATAPILDVTDDAGHALIGFARSGEDLLFGVWSGAARARFRGATVRLDGAFRNVQPGATATFVASVDRRRLVLTRHGPEPLRAERRLTADQGWRLLLPARGGVADTLATAAWLGVPAVVVAFWAMAGMGRLHPRARRAAGASPPDS